MADKIRDRVDDVLRVGNVIQFLWVGVPVVVSVGTGVWAYLEDLPGSLVFTLALATGACTLAIARYLGWGRKEERVNASGANPASALKEVNKQTFTNETVQLDGHSYIECVFNGCAFQWEGGNYRFINCKLNGKRGLISSKREIGRAFELFTLVMLDKEMKKKLQLIRAKNPLGEGRK